MAEQAKDKRASLTDSHSPLSHSISGILGFGLMNEPETDSEKENSTSEYQEKKSNMKKMHVDQDDTSPSSPVFNENQSKPCLFQYTYVT